MKQSCPRIVLAAPSSGSGKTMITCAILQLLVKRGFQLASFKCGPDYIDPMFHERVIGTQSSNLDTFFLEPIKVKQQFVDLAKTVDFSVIEGVMGYFDGVGGVSSEASTYDVAKTIDSPVILVVNGRGMSCSIIAIIKGFMDYEEEKQIKGVILNQISLGLFERLKPLIESQLGIQVLGYVPVLTELKIESRHLGLQMPLEILDLKEKLNKLSVIIEKTIDMDSLIAIGNKASLIEYSEKIEYSRIDKKEPKIQIAVAYDEAFCFYYKENLNLLKAAGATLIYFSPLHNQKLPEGIHGLILGGGYPELYAKELSLNRVMIDEILSAITKKMPVIAECGGFMYLHQWMEGVDGTPYKMVGAIPEKVIKTNSLKRFGYISVTSKVNNFLLKKGQEIKGHEFHYWDSSNNGSDFLAKKPYSDKSWACIHCTDHIMAGFPHLYYPSNPQFVTNFLAACRNYQGDKL